MYETRLSVAERATAAIEPVKRKLAQRRLGVLEAGGLLERVMNFAPIESRV